MALDRYDACNVNDSYLAPVLFWLRDKLCKVEFVLDQKKLFVAATEFVTTDLISNRFADGYQVILFICQSKDLAQQFCARGVHRKMCQVLRIYKVAACLFLYQQSE